MVSSSLQDSSVVEWSLSHSMFPSVCGPFSRHESILFAIVNNFCLPRSFSCLCAFMDRGLDTFSMVQNHRTHLYLFPLLQQRFFWQLTRHSGLSGVQLFLHPIAWVTHGARFSCSGAFHQCWFLWLVLHVSSVVLCYSFSCTCEALHSSLGYLSARSKLDTMSGFAFLQVDSTSPPGLLLGCRSGIGGFLRC